MDEDIYMATNEKNPTAVGSVKPGASRLETLYNLLPPLKRFLINHFTIKNVKKVAEVSLEVDDKIITPLDEFSAIFMEQNKGLTAPELEKSIDELGAPLHGVSLGIHIYSLVALIPYLVINAKIYGKDLPFTLTITGKLFYVSLGIALSIAMLAVPPVAPILATALAGVELVNSVFLISKLINKYFEYNKALKQAESRLISLTGGKKYEVYAEYLNHLSGEVTKFEIQKKQETDSGKIIEIEKSLKLATKNYREALGLIEKITMIKENKERLLKEYAPVRSITTLSTALIFIGFTVGLFFPPAGIAISTIGVVMGVTIGAIVITPKIISAVSAIKNWFTKTRPKQGGEHTPTDTPTPSEDHAHGQQQTYSAIPAHISVHETEDLPDNTATKDAFTQAVAKDAERRAITQTVNTLNPIPEKGEDEEDEDIDKRPHL